MHQPHPHRRRRERPQDSATFAGWPLLLIAQKPADPDFQSQGPAEHSLAQAGGQTKDAQACARLFRVQGAGHRGRRRSSAVHESDRVPGLAGFRRCSPDVEAAREVAKPTRAAERPRQDAHAGPVQLDDVPRPEEAARQVWHRATTAVAQSARSKSRAACNGPADVRAVLSVQGAGAAAERPALFQGV